MGWNFLLLDDRGKSTAFWMVETPSPNRHPGWPLDSLSRNRDTMTYFVDHGNELDDSAEEQTTDRAYRQRVADFLRRVLGV